MDKGSVEAPNVSRREVGGDAAEATGQARCSRRRSGG